MSLVAPAVVLPQKAGLRELHYEPDVCGVDNRASGCIVDGNSTGRRCRSGAAVDLDVVSVVARDQVDGIGAAVGEKDVALSTRAEIACAAGECIGKHGTGKV